MICTETCVIVGNRDRCIKIKRDEEIAILGH